LQHQPNPRQSPQARDEQPPIQPVIGLPVPARRNNASFGAGPAACEQRLTNTVKVTEIPQGDPEELIGVPEVARMLGYARPQTIYAYLDNNPGYFPEPAEVSYTDGGRARRKWKRKTITAWAQARAGKGNTSPKTRQQTPIPPEPEDGKVDELLSARQVAVMLGYSATGSSVTAGLVNAIERGRHPELAEPDEQDETEDGRLRRRWRRGRVVDEARRLRDLYRAEQLEQATRVALARQALEAAADEAKVTAAGLAKDHAAHGTDIRQWRAALQEARAELAAERSREELTAASSVGGRRRQRATEASA
jgi:predicted DNA-binding transcriptional regulator AlpA